MVDMSNTPEAPNTQDIEALRNQLAVSNQQLIEAAKQLEACNTIILKLEELLKEAYKVNSSEIPNSSKGNK